MEMFLIITVLLLTSVQLSQTSYRNGQTFRETSMSWHVHIVPNALKSGWKAGAVRFTIAQTEQHLDSFALLLSLCL